MLLNFLVLYGLLVLILRRLVVRCLNKILRHHNVLGNERFLVLTIFLLKIARKDVTKIGLASFSLRLQKEIFVVDHKFS